MKASKLIENLQLMIDKYGDNDVLALDYYCGETNNHLVTEITFEPNKYDNFDKNQYFVIKADG